MPSVVDESAFLAVGVGFGVDTGHPSQCGGTSGDVVDRGANIDQENADPAIVAQFSIRVGRGGIMDERSSGCDGSWQVLTRRRGGRRNS
jgi:hypothetical protein